MGQIIVPTEGKVVKQRVPLKEELVEEEVKPLTRQEAFQQQVRIVLLPKKILRMVEGRYNWL